MSSSLEQITEIIKKTPVKSERAEGQNFKVHPLRSDIRYKLFRYRNSGDVLVPGLAEHFENQFRAGWNWDNFSHVWDISPVDPLKAIPEREWLTEGGAAVEPREGETITAARFHPNAFTRQAR
jgi:hypothetical protein